MLLKCLLSDRRNRCEVCSTAAGVEVLVWSKLHNQETQNASSVPVSRVPGQYLGPYRFMLPITLSLSPSLGTLFPFDHIPVKTCSAIYSRVVLFYPPVSICSTPKYGGLPACWRQQCNAAEGWLECERGKGKRKADRKKLNDKKEGIGLEDAWHQGVGRASAWNLWRKVTRFISVCSSKFREKSMWLLLSSFHVM